jgi:hypothetical protein
VNSIESQYTGSIVMANAPVMNRGFGSGSRTEAILYQYPDRSGVTPAPIISYSWGLPRVLSPKEIFRFGPGVHLGLWLFAWSSHV